MEKSQFYLPVQILMGRNCVTEQAPEVLQKLGKKALLVTGRHSAKINGAYDDVVQALEKNQQAYQLYDQIMSNPTIDSVYEGAHQARQFSADFVIAIGGGSPMDAAKAIALLACQDIPRDQLFQTPLQGRTLPVVCIPTTAGTGSEVTQYSVLTNDAQKTKTSLSHPCLFPQIALLDGKYMLPLSEKNTIHTTLDALSHLVESFLSRKANPVSKTLAVKGLQMLAPYLKNLDTLKLTAEDRDALLQASLLGGVVIAQTSTTAVHLLGYPLTYFHHIDHGRANALLLGAYLEKVEQQYPKAVQEVLDALQCDDLAQLRTILDRLLGRKEMLTREEIIQFAETSLRSPKSQSGIISLTQEDLEDIYRQSLRL